MIEQPSYQSPTSQRAETEMDLELLDATTSVADTVLPDLISKHLIELSNTNDSVILDEPAELTIPALETSGVTRPNSQPILTHSSLHRKIQFIQWIAFVNGFRSAESSFFIAD